MTTSVIPFGTPIAPAVRDASTSVVPEARSLNTLGDLLNIWAENPPPSFPMLRSTCALLGKYLNEPADQISIDRINESREDLRAFLQRSKYTEASIRSYINFARILLKSAKCLGWKPIDSIPEAWRGVLALAADKRCTTIVKYFARTKKLPRDVTVEDVDQYVQLQVQKGKSLSMARVNKGRFWHLLQECGCIGQRPSSLLRGKNYRVPFDQFSSGLRNEVLALRKWKCEEYSIGRPKDGRHREVTSKALEDAICTLLGFVVNILEEPAAATLSELVQERIVGGFIEWSINVRKVKGRSLQRNLCLISAAMRQHPFYKLLDLRWFKILVDGLSLERSDALKKRKAVKYVAYDILDTIPATIRALRPAAEKKGKVYVARLAMEELLMRWLLTLPWRQRNIRECRSGGSMPNLFKATVPTFSGINKPAWVRNEERKNPATEFWQFKFSAEETKTGNPVEALLPTQLIAPVEEYIAYFRPYLVRGDDPGTLFLNQAGTPLTLQQMTALVSKLTQQHGGRPVSPHPFRDIVAFAWLDAHPDKYLELSKMLWHNNINTTIQIYGGRFNESSGVCAMESWLDERAASSK